MYVLDSSILIEFSNYYYPEFFPSFWDHLKKLIKEGEVFSLKEVQAELKKSGGKKVFNEWEQINNEFDKQFYRELSNKEINQLKKIEEIDIFKEKFKIKNKTTSLKEEWGLYNELCADPWLICYGLANDTTIVTLESPNKGHNIPHVCFELGVNCIGIKQFFLETELQI